MSARARFPLPNYEIELVRPLLDVPRAELREYLKARGADWLEDPMNADSRFARARLRELMPQLESAGISAMRIARAAAHLSRAREALDAAAEAFITRHTKLEPHGLIDAPALRSIAREVGLRVLSSCLLAIGGTRYRPRFERLESLYDSIVSPNFAGARTLAGCRIGLAPRARQFFGPATIEIRRERPRKTALAPGNQAR